MYFPEIRAKFAELRKAIAQMQDASLSEEEIATIRPLTTTILDLLEEAFVDLKVIALSQGE